MTDELVLRRHIAVIEADNQRMAAMLKALRERFPLLHERLIGHFDEELTPAAYAALVEEAICAKLREFVRAYERVYVHTQRHPTIADEAEVMRLLGELPK